MLHDTIFFFTGLIIGAMNAIAGGGMLIGFPVLLALGVPAIVANATANISILPGSLSSAFGYRRYVRKVPQLYLFLIIPCAIGAAIGATLLRRTPFDGFQSLVPGLILFAVVLFAFQPLLHFHIHRHIHSRPKYRDLQTFLIIALALLPVAIYGGYFGAGFGFIMLAFLGFTSMHDMHQMNALKNLATATIALVSICCLFFSHLIDWHIGGVMAVGTAIGGYYGALFAQKVSSHTIRVVVIIIGLTTAAYLGLRSY
jgi:uncharacterized protein